MAAQPFISHKSTCALENLEPVIGRLLIGSPIMTHQRIQLQTQPCAAEAICLTSLFVIFPTGTDGHLGGDVGQLAT